MKAKCWNRNLNSEYLLLSLQCMAVWWFESYDLCIRQLEMYFTEKQQSCFISVVCDWQTSKLKSLKEISQKCVFKTAGKNSKLWGWSALNQILPTSRLCKLGAKVLYLLSFYVFGLIYEKSHITESNRTQLALTERHNYHSMKFYKEDEIW